MKEDNEYPKIIKDIEFSDSVKEAPPSKKISSDPVSKEPDATEDKKVKPKRSKFKFCCFSCVILLVLLLLGAVSALAASGLMYIPGFSQVLYREPQPTRIVKAIEVDNIEEYFTQKFEAEYSKKGEDQKLKTEITEEEITTLIQYNFSIKERGKNPDLSDLQVVILPKHLEFFGRVKRGPINTVFILNIKPEIKDEKLYFRPKNLRIGALKIPVEWIFSISNLDKYINQPIKIAEDIDILDLELSDKEAEVELYFKSLKSDLLDPFSESKDNSPYQSI